MWETRAEAETSAPPERVGELWADPRRWGEWNDEIASVRAEEPLARGARVRIRLKRSFPQRFAITAFEPNVVLTDETRLPGARLGHEHRLGPAGDRTLIVHRLYLDGPAVRVWSLLLGRRLRAAANRFPERERALVE